MIFLCKSNGTITAAIPTPINQGSIGVNEIILLAPFPVNSVIYAAFTLPNGLLTYPKFVGNDVSEEDKRLAMTILTDFVGIKNSDGETLNAWKMTLDRSLTQFAGNLTVQFYVVSQQGEVMTTDSSTAPVNKGSAYLAPTVTEGDLNTIAGYLSAANTAAQNAAASAALAEYYTTLQWDYIITNAEDFTTKNLATMSGNVLVTGFSVSDETLIDVRIGENIKLIKFDNVEMFANLEADGQTKIVGFVGLLHDYQDTRYSILRGFTGVEFCSGAIDLSFCSNVIHCKIHTATDCFNLSDIDVIDSFLVQDHSSFIRCNVLNNIRITPNESGLTYAEFKNCKYLSNVFNYSAGTSEKVTIHYNNCLFVDGNTCDGYFTSEDEDKVQVIKLDGTKQTISVYDQLYIDGKFDAAESNLKTVESIAKGATQGIVFDSYSIMVEDLNNYSNNKLIIGQHIYIETSNVPDLWVSGIAEIAKEYPLDGTGTDQFEERFAEALKSGAVQVGFYYLSPLETQKVDLTGYLEKPTTDINYNVVPYVRPDGTEGRDTVSNNPIANAIVKRTPSKQIRLPNQLDAEPLEDEAISRRYFEANKGNGGKLYLHTVGVYAATDYDDIEAAYLTIYLSGEVFVYSTSPIPITDPDKAFGHGSFNCACNNYSNILAAYNGHYSGEYYFNYWTGSNYVGSLNIPENDIWVEYDDVMEV